jgi:hypothetical protein
VVVDWEFVVAEGVHGHVGGGGEDAGEHVDGRTEAGMEVGREAECVERIEEEFVSACWVVESVVEGGLADDARGVV